jgi:hypothetical protein
MFKLHRNRSQQAGHPPRKRSRARDGVLAAGLAVIVAATGLRVGLAAGAASASGTSGKVSATASTAADQVNADKLRFGPRPR